jgi:ATP-dependent Clp protease ATP-binding subunit ClpC
MCGLSMDVLDSNRTLNKEEIVKSIADQVIGQDEAVEAMADAMVRCKARLSDPDKPLAAYLFAGPTGVGKTECAKALAKTLFNSEEKLLRFDMNEFKSADAATLLAGNPWQPEGHLTSAVRSNPFSVILLDEIEKAHPAVFDLLLQVLGEGRLTDSLGRTADFTNSIIIMTSNLGSREASRSLGFSDKEDPQTYLSSVKKFFRPEFFNRIDKVIPFTSLSKTQIRSIAAKMIEKVLKREGLKRRQCILDVDDNVLDLLVDVGYSPKMGARAMNRAVEKEVAKPVSAQLVPVKGGQPLILRIKKKDNKLNIKSTPFEIAEPAEIFNLQESFPELQEELSELSSLNESLVPEGIQDWNNLSSAQYHFFNMKDRIEGALKRWEQLDEMISNNIQTRQNPFSKVSSPMTVIEADSDISVFFSSGVRNYTRKCLKNNPVFGSEIHHRVFSLVCYSYLLDLMTNAEESTAELHFSGLAGRNSDNEAKELIGLYSSFFEEELHLAVTKSKNKLVLQGWGARELVALECGIHLFYTEDSRPLPVLVSDGNEELLKVIRAYTPDGAVFDFRSLLLTKARPENWHYMRFLSYAAVFSYEEEEENDG